MHQRPIDPNVSHTRKIAVVGGGWAGCAAAVELSRQGEHVTLFESARTLGGRARRVDIDAGSLDNGQHILLGAYSESLRMMRMVGIDIEQAFLRLPLQIRYPKDSGGMDFIAPRLPAPFHLLVALWRANGLAKEDKLALARFSTTARWMDWQLNNDCSVAELLVRYDQTERLIKLMWRPLCIAALNTPPERASARVFLNVLRDSLGSHRAASDMLIPRVDLTTLFPLQAAGFIESHNGDIRQGSTVKEIVRSSQGWQLKVNGNADESNNDFDSVIIATQAFQAMSLLNGLVDTNKMAAFEYESITTCYLQYAPDLRLQQPFFALNDDADRGHWGQFVFDRGALAPNQNGLLAVVVSSSREAIDVGHENLARAIAAQLSEALRMPELIHPKWTKVISEKRATFSCTPDLIRPEHKTAHDGLVIAGDYVACDYPATLESAVRSGIAAAQTIAKNNS